MAVQTATIEEGGGTTETQLHYEVEKRYLAYALSTIVSRALPDVRDGLKPVHRRILYAMHAMHLNDAAKMRKSAAIVGEVIGKYHPHGDQAAYDALVRMAQDFSLRYPLVDGSGNFGSVDGDAPAAMRYTEIRLSAFAGILLKEIDQGTTNFRPTYDSMGEEPDVLPSGVPNLLLNGSSGIAVGMSCSFPPHNLGEVLAACRAVMRDPGLDSRGLLKYIHGPDFPTGGEILDQPGGLAEIYRTGHGSIRLRGTYEVETMNRGRSSIIVTSIPYSVNKSRLIERIAGLITDKKLKHVIDIRDESTQDVRIVLELRGVDVAPDSVMAFLYKHSDLQINFPVNLIAITPHGVPDRLSLLQIIRYFLDFRYEKTVQRLQHRLAFLQKRMHILVGLDLLFQDLDQALKIIRSSRSRHEAALGLKQTFPLDDEQVDAILEMRLYKLVGMEIGKVLEELGIKKREAFKITRDLASPERLWKIIDGELSEISGKFRDDRRTKIMEEKDAQALEYDPDQFLEHDDSTVILSRQGWIRRMKSEVYDLASLKFREGDGLFGLERVNTGRNVAIFSNLGKVYVIRAIDVPATTGFGEPIGTFFNLEDGETVVGFMAPDPLIEGPCGTEPLSEDPRSQIEVDHVGQQADLFAFTVNESGPEKVSSVSGPVRGIVVTRLGRGFRFGYDLIREPSKRGGRKIVTLREGDETVCVKPEEGKLIAVYSDIGNILIFPVDQAPVLGGPGQGVLMIRLRQGSLVVSLDSVDPDDKLLILPKKGREKTVSVGNIPAMNRGGQGRKLCDGLAEVQRIKDCERQGL